MSELLPTLRDLQGLCDHYTATKRVHRARLIDRLVKQVDQKLGRYVDYSEIEDLGNEGDITRPISTAC